MIIRNLRQFKARFLQVWTEFLILVTKICILMSFILIPVLLVLIISSVYHGYFLTALIQSLILVLDIYVNKQL